MRVRMRVITLKTGTSPQTREGRQTVVEAVDGEVVALFL
jgi:hypothetical protein